MKRVIFALLLTFAAVVTGTGAAMADTESGSGIVGTQSP
jgi:hypothetical protein